LSILSTHILETKIQKYLSNKSNVSQIFIFSLMAAIPSLALLIIFLSNGAKSEYRSASMSDKSIFLDMNLEIKNHLYDEYLLKCDFYDNEKNIKKESISNDCYNVSNKKHSNILIWGDSHAQALSFGIRESVSPDTAVFQIATSDCRPAIGASKRKSRVDNNCDKSNGLALQSIARIKPDYVIIEQEKDHELTNWNEISQKIKSLGAKKVIIAGPLPQYSPSLPFVYVKHAWGDKFIDKKFVNSDVINTDNAMEKKEDSEYEYISLINSLCNDYKCAVSSGNGDIFAFDYGHLTPSGSAVVGQIILDKIYKKNRK
ncbi:SGNH hydrolase domain-containing protein, partial [Citrobacter portucalensis]|uniref:SGNH hydrolase domain-containing protein n=1 Tax=Citrobacter portucalensis TaxID=1639133 RepID=UPI00226B0257